MIHCQARLSILRTNQKYFRALKAVLDLEQVSVCVCVFATATTYNPPPTTATTYNPPPTHL
jgi:hypothetical protein